eukprot:3176755-Alexandrium_andersonii.AAC.2
MPSNTLQLQGASIVSRRWPIDGHPPVRFSSHCLYFKVPLRPCGPSAKVVLAPLPEQAAFSSRNLDLARVAACAEARTHTHAHIEYKWNDINTND